MSNRVFRIVRSARSGSRTGHRAPTTAPLAMPLVLMAAMLLSTVAPAAEWDNPADRYLDAHRAYVDATCPLPEDGIRHFVYFARDRERLPGHVLLRTPRLAGAQIMYAWTRLEAQGGVYDFSEIEADLATLEAHGKRLWIQLQDATFDDRYPAVPAWLRTPEFGGGAVHQRNDAGETEGWVAMRWNPAVRERFARLLSALGERFDGRIEGINLQESSIGVDADSDPGFTPLAYRDGLLANMSALKRAFPRSVTMQYANFMPGEWLPWEDEGHLAAIYRHGEAIGVGLGAPDLMVTRKGQLNHALAMMHEHDYSVPLGIAVQDGNYAGVTGRERAEDAPPTSLVPSLHAFAADFLRVNYLFWVDQPPYFGNEVVPCLGAREPDVAPP